MDYGEPDFMDFDAEMEAKNPENDWKLVGGKQTLRPHKEATQTPLPASSECRNKLLGATDTNTHHIGNNKSGPNIN